MMVRTTTGVVYASGNLPAGATLELPKPEAQRWITAGLAEPVKQPAEKNRRTKTAGPDEIKD